MSAITKTIEDSAKGYTHIFEMNGLSINLSASITKTIKRDGVELSTDNTNAQININGQVQTEEQITQLETQDPRVREFIELLMEKATEKYVFETPSAKAAKA